ncbi:hypothetical protein SLS62_008435 [Diatrype stigma]|uniref:Glucan 1,3-beta-glucosidase n=1 Tax=Diatrype stigma TaxID=117547 RepID=A0AAN9YNR3_9PEZI
MRFTTTLSLAAAATAVYADGENYLGFNSGATKADRSAKFKDDFLAEFKTAQGLKGAPGDFNAVRLYTNIQAYSETDPIQAFEAAIETKTKILLGIWTSGTDNIDKELTALQNAVKQYGTELTDLVIGISIGSEDLYRDSATGIENKSGVGASPDAIIGFIKDFKDSVKDTGLSDVPIGHVDTWDAWTNTTNKAVIDAVDWLGIDEYPYYETGKGNSIDNAGQLFGRAYDASIAAAGGKPVWVTETGWPTTGPDWDQAVPSTENAKKYWQDIGCKKLFGKTPTFWYNLRDSNPDNEMKFAVSKDLTTEPLFDLSCDGITADEPSSSASGTASATSKPTGSSTGSATATSTGTTASDSSLSDSSSSVTISSSLTSPSATSGTNAQTTGGSSPSSTGSADSGSGDSASSEEASSADSSSAAYPSVEASASTQLVSFAAYAGLALAAAGFTLL